MNLSSERILVGLALLAATPAVVAGMQRYGASEHHSTWELGPSSPLHCSLVHDVPRYGTAVFAKEAGGELTFTLAPLRPPAVTGTAELLSVPPHWRHDVRAETVGRVDYRPEPAAFRLHERSSLALIGELEQGMFPTFVYRDWLGGRDTVSVAISPINLKQRVQDFSACLAQVVPYSFEEVRSTTLQFDPYVTELNDAQRERLQAVATYMAADPAVSGVAVDSYTDSWGFRRLNQDLSEKRAKAVREYLLSLGVDAGKLAVEAHGEKDPLVSNRTRQGRDINRRLQVVLSK